jgi:NADH-quinone oxidoreductase subunit M
MIITLASIGLPGLNGFVGEFLIMLGAFRWDARFVVVAGLGVILSAVYMLWMFQRVYYGEVTHEENTTLRDLLPREWAAVVPLCVMAVVMGVFPTLFLKPMEASVDAVVQRVQQGQTLRAERVESAERLERVERSAFALRTSSTTKATARPRHGSREAQAREGGSER